MGKGDFTIVNALVGFCGVGSLGALIFVGGSPIMGAYLVNPVWSMYRVSPPDPAAGLLLLETESWLGGPAVPPGMADAIAGGKEPVMPVMVKRSE